LVLLPTRVSLNYIFNSGSFLGIALVSQVVSGLLLVLYYNTGDSYGTVVFIVIEVHGG